MNKRQDVWTVESRIVTAHVPVNNIIPEWNELVYDEDWENALKTLHSTNNFPEFTGRICPAPCEASCTLNIEDNPVAIKGIERSIIDKGYEMGWVVPQINKNKTEKKIAVVGSGPSWFSKRSTTCKSRSYGYCFREK